MKEKCPNCGTEFESSHEKNIVRLTGYKDEAVLAEMDKATEDAAADFDKLSNDIKQIVGEFIREWVAVAGYKRLAKLFYDYVKEADQ